MRFSSSVFFCVGWVLSWLGLLRRARTGLAFPYFYTFILFFPSDGWSIEMAFLFPFLPGSAWSYI